MLRHILGLLMVLSSALAMWNTALAEAPSNEKTRVTHEPKFSKMELSVLMIGYQGKKYDVSEDKGTSGCTSRFEPKYSLNPQVEYGITCGWPGEVSKVTWSYMHTDQEGDHYEITRQFPYEDLDQKTPKKKVTFQGKPIVVFEDKSHRITLRVAKPKDEKSDSKTSRD